MTREEQIKQAAFEYADTEFVGIIDFKKEAAFIEGATWADTHPHWISVKDELPQCNIPYPHWNGLASDIMESEKVIALIDNGKMCIATFNQNIDEETKKPVGEPYWFDEGKTEDGGWIDGKVTHWLPLPEETKWTEHILQRDKDGFLVGEVSDLDVHLPFEVHDNKHDTWELIEDDSALVDWSGDIDTKPRYDRIRTREQVVPKTENTACPKEGGDQ